MCGKYLHFLFNDNRTVSVPVRKKKTKKKTLIAAKMREAPEKRIQIIRNSSHHYQQDIRASAVTNQIEAGRIVDAARSCQRQ